MPRGLTDRELLAEKAKAIRNRNRWALKSQALLEQGKRDEARLKLARADFWELERQKLEKMQRTRAADRTLRRARRTPSPRSRAKR